MNEIIERLESRTMEDDSTATNAAGGGVSEMSRRWMDSVHSSRISDSEGPIRLRRDELAAKFLSRTGIDTDNGWAAAVDRFEQMSIDARATAEYIVNETGTHAGSRGTNAVLVTNVALAFEALTWVAETLELQDDARDLVDLHNGLGRQILSLVATLRTHHVESAPGMMLIRAVAGLLSTGRAHVVNARDPKIVPLTDSEGHASPANSKLGWFTEDGAEGDWSPQGDCIGEVIEKEGQKIILFKVDEALAKAYDAYPYLVPPRHGKKSPWAAIWNEGLNPESMSRQTNSRGDLVTTVRLSKGLGYARDRPTGVPVPVETILSRGPARP